MYLYIIIYPGFYFVIKHLDGIHIKMMKGRQVRIRRNNSDKRITSLLNGHRIKEFRKMK